MPDMKTAEVHRRIREIYGENVMNDGLVRKWVRTFKNGHTNMQNKQRFQRYLMSFL